MKGTNVITGASSPLGLELSKSLLEKQKRCIFLVRDAQKLNCLNTFDKQLFEIWQTDLGNETEIKKVGLELTNYKQKIWSFMHLAATSVEDNFDSLQMQKTFLINVFSAWELAKSCMKKMSNEDGGRILFVGSVGHKYGGKEKRPGYCSSKYLLEYFPKSFKECASKNILINTLQLGVMTGGTHDSIGTSKSEFNKRVQLIPTKRDISKKEAVRSISFLCSPDNQSIHNSVLSCSGGE